MSSRSENSPERKTPLGGWQIWKVAGLILVSLLTLRVWTLDTGHVQDAALFFGLGDIDGIEVTSGVKAALCAMTAAGFALVGLIPAGEKLTGDALFSLFIQLAGGVVAFSAGWFWLSGETDDTPVPYILPMVVLGFIVGLGIIAQAAIVVVGNIFRGAAAPEEERVDSRYHTHIVILENGEDLTELDKVLTQEDEKGYSLRSVTELTQGPSQTQAGKQRLLVITERNP